MAYLVFDIGGTSVKYAIYQENELSHQDAFLTPPTWDKMKEALNSVLLKFNQDYDFKGVAISAPGSTNIKKGVIEGVSAIDYLHHFPIRQELETLFNLPVSLENDANCAALAELWQGVAQGEENILFVVIGTGIGGAVIIDGQLQRGSHLFAGEFGLMLLEPNVSFSLNATPVHMAEKYCQRKNLPLDSVSGKEVFDLAKTDSIAKEEVTRFYDYLAQGLFNLQFITDPNMIVLGGGVSQYEPLIPELNQQLKQKMKTANITDFSFNIKACHFKNDANLLGAVYSFMQQHNIE